MHPAPNLFAILANIKVRVVLRRMQYVSYARQNLHIRYILLLEYHRTQIIARGIVTLGTFRVLTFAFLAEKDLFQIRLVYHLVLVVVSESITSFLEHPQIHFAFLAMQDHIHHLCSQIHVLTVVCVHQEPINLYLQVVLAVNAQLTPITLLLEHQH